MKILRYLDEVNYFLETSDHDLFARAYVERGWICGYVPIDFIKICIPYTVSIMFYDKYCKKNSRKIEQNIIEPISINALPIIEKLENSNIDFDINGRPKSIFSI